MIICSYFLQTHYLLFTFTLCFNTSFTYYSLFKSLTILRAIALPMDPYAPVTINIFFINVNIKNLKRISKYTY